MKTRLLILIIFILTAAAVSAQDAESKTAEENTLLGYDSYMKIISEKAPSIAQENLTLENKKLSVKSAEGAGDVSFSADSVYKYAESDSDSSQYSRGIYSSGTISKKFTSTGTVVSGTLDYSAAEIYSAGQSGTVAGTDAYTPSFTVSVQQPLLKNFFGKVDRYAKKNAEAEYEIQKLNNSMNISSISDYYALLYFQWTAALRKTENYSNYVKSAQVLYDQTLRKRKSGLADNDDVQKSYISLLKYRANYENSILDLKKIENEIFTLTASGTAAPDREFFNKFYTDILNEEVIEKEFRSTTNYRIMNMTLNNLIENASVASSQALPDFDVIASLTRKDSDENAADAWSFDKTEYSVGFQFTYTFGNNSAEAARETALNNVEIYRSTIIETEQDFTERMKNDVESITVLKKLISFQEKNLEALNSQFATETVKYAQARITLETLISTRNSISTSLNDLTDLKLSLISTYLDYKSLSK